MVWLAQSESPVHDVGNSVTIRTDLVSLRGVSRHSCSLFLSGLGLSSAFNGFLALISRGIYVLVLADGDFFHRGASSGFGADLLEDGQTRLAWHCNVEVADVGLGNQVDSRRHDGRVLAEQVLVARALALEVRKVDRGVAELAAAPVLAVPMQVGLAEGHSELACHVSLLEQLLRAVGEGALLAELALLAIEPELADLGSFFLFVGRLGRHRCLASFHPVALHSLQHLRDVHLQRGQVGSRSRFQEGWLELGDVDGHGREEAVPFGLGEQANFFEGQSGVVRTLLLLGAGRRIERHLGSEIGDVIAVLGTVTALRATAVGHVHHAGVHLLDAVLALEALLSRVQCVHFSEAVPQLRRASEVVED